MSTTATAPHLTCENTQPVRQILKTCASQADRTLFVDCATAPDSASNKRMFSEIREGTLPQGAFSYPGPLLAVAAERESASAEKAFPAIRAALPQTQTWIAPKLHHAWSVEDPDLFTRMVTTFADSGQWP